MQLAYNPAFCDCINVRSGKSTAIGKIIQQKLNKPDSVFKMQITWKYPQDHEFCVCELMEPRQLLAQ